MRTTPAVTTLLAAIALLAAACGEEASTDAGPDGERAAVPASAPAQPPATDGPWVVRFEVGSDEMPSAVSYVRFVPDTGETRVTTIQQPPLDVEPNPLTLVDAGRSWAVLANAASFREQRQGTVTVHSLESKAERRLDLVELTGRPLLRPLGWAFDPAEPGLLRVLDRSGRVYEVDVDAEEVTGSDRVQVPKGYALAPVFDSATGLPLLREKRTYEYQSGGEYAAGGLSVVDPGDAPDTGVCRDEAALTAAVVDGTGTAWSACLQGDAVRLASQADDATEWTEVGESAADVPAAASSMTWVLPPL